MQKTWSQLLVNDTYYELDNNGIHKHVVKKIEDKGDKRIWINGCGHPEHSKNSTTGFQCATNFEEAVAMKIEGIENSIQWAKERHITELIDYEKELKKYRKMIK
jgi:hypothetical protein